MKVTFDFVLDQVTVEVHEIPRVGDEVELSYDKKCISLEVLAVVHRIEKVEDGLVGHRVTVVTKLI